MTLQTLTFRIRHLLGTCLVLAVSLSFAWSELQAEEERELPDAEDVSFETQDRVVIKATYWEPLDPGKSTVPIILLHGWQGKRQEFDVLGRRLQEEYHHAVLSIDLRGHGGSTVVRIPAADRDGEIDPDRMNKRDFLAMVYDVQAAKSFLLKKHREGKLNIELLTIVGADMGSIVALNFAVYDWNQPQVAARIYKRGQDVKGLVLLSPPKSFKGMSRELALQNRVVRGLLSTMIIVGANDKDAMSDAQSLHSSLAKFHYKLPRNVTDAEREEKMDLFLMKPNTTLQGTKLLADALRTDAMIKEFVQLRLVNKSDDVPWMERE